MRHLLDQLEILQQSGPSGPTVNDYSSLATQMPASVAVCFGWVLVCYLRERRTRSLNSAK